MNVTINENIIKNTWKCSCGGTEFKDAKTCLVENIMETGKLPEICFMITCIKCGMFSTVYCILDEWIEWPTCRKGEI